MEKYKKRLTETITLKYQHLSNIQEYFQYIFKKHEENTNNPSIRIYVNKIENRITF